MTTKQTEMSTKSETVGERLYLVMAGGDVFQSTIVSESQLDDAYLLTQWGRLEDINPQERADALAHFHDEDLWTHEQITGLGARVDFSLNLEDGWVKVIRLPSTAMLSASPAAPEGANGDKATIAGLESAVGHLSRLVDEQRVLLVEVNDVCGRDAYGLEFEDGDSELIDKVRAHLAATQATDAAKPEPEPQHDAPACMACGVAPTYYAGEDETELPGTYCDNCGPRAKAAKPEQQAQAGEPDEKFAYDKGTLDIPSLESLGLNMPTPREYAAALRVRWQKKLDEAIAKKDAALLACVEALEHVRDANNATSQDLFFNDADDEDMQPSYDKLNAAIQNIDAAITQAKEQLK